MERKRVCLFSLGSSIGDRLSYLRFALSRIGDWPGTNLVLVSSVYETEPVGGVAENLFLNAAACVETELPPEEILSLIHKIEHEAGRNRPVRWDDRTLDIDILYYGDLIAKTEALEIPHPRLADRRFVLVPLAEIAPDFRDPASGVSVSDLLRACADRAAVTLKPDLKLNLPEPPRLPV